MRCAPVLLKLQSPCCYFFFFFFSLLFCFVMHAPGSSKKLSCAFNRRCAPTVAKHRAVSLICPCSFSSTISCTSVAKLLPPEPPSPVGVSLKRFPFYRLRFRTFLLFLLPFMLLIVVRALNLRTTTLSFSDFSLGYSCFL